MENKCLQDTWRQGCDCLVSRAHFWLRTERPWSTKTTGLIMWVHRKVSQHCCANHVSGHRLKAGQMLGKGQWGYVILIRGGFGGFVNLVACLTVTLQRENCHRFFSCSVCLLLLPSLTCSRHHSLVFTRTSSLASTNCVFFLFNRAHFFFCYQPPTHSNELPEHTLIFLLVDSTQ